MGRSALKARLGWLTLFPLIDEKGKASDWDKCLALAYSRNDLRSQEQQVESLAAALHTCIQNICGQH